MIGTSKTFIPQSATVYSGGAMCVMENKLVLRGLKMLLRLFLRSFSVKASVTTQANHPDLTGGRRDL